MRFGSPKWKFRVTLSSIREDKMEILDKPFLESIPRSTDLEIQEPHE